MKRGEIYIVDFTGGEGSEANKRRPAVVISNDLHNAAIVRAGQGVVAVAPLTSNVDMVYDFQVFIPALVCGNSKDSKIQIEQLRSVTLGRVMGHPIGRLNAELTEEMNRALKLHLSLFYSIN